jgi:hypothetical protein
MNSELLTLHRLTAGVLFPPFGLQPVDVNRIYASITERYPYQSLQHLPDGARMANADNDCFIQQTRIQINESVQLHFEATKQKCVDLFSMIQGHLNIPQFLTFGIKLTAFLPMDQAPRAALFIEQKMLPEVASRLDVLGEGRQGVGLRIVLHKEAAHEIKIEPFFGDLSQLYVELDVQHPNPFAEISFVSGWMDSAYNYLFGEVKSFIGSFA